MSAHCVSLLQVSPRLSSASCDLPEQRARGKVFTDKQTNQPIDKHSEARGAAQRLINRTTVWVIARTEKSTTNRILNTINRARLWLC